MRAEGPARYGEAADWYARALDRARAIGSRSAMGWALAGAGELALQRGERREARASLEEALAIFQAIGLRHDVDNAARLLSDMKEGAS
jgi:tetratricopeptide (TPR) repeat protein